MEPQSLVSRRSLIVSSLAAFGVYALVHEAALADTATGVTVRRWIDTQQQLAQALAGGTIGGQTWHDEVNALAKRVDVEQLVAEIGRARIEAVAPPSTHDPQKRFVTFLGADGSPLSLAYGVATFTFDAKSVITPHAHQHMASAHMVIDGKVRIRTFDRVADEPGTIVIRPTRDEISAPGGAAAMTTAKDNVHWFTPVGSHATTLDVIVDGLDRGQPDYVITPVDPLRGTHRPDGTIAAPILSFDESSRLYTASM